MLAIKDLVKTAKGIEFMASLLNLSPEKANESAERIRKENGLKYEGEGVELFLEGGKA